VVIDGRARSWSSDVHDLRGRFSAMIFQDPSATLSPVRSVGSQLIEVLRVIRRLPRAAARAEAVELLDRVGIPDPSRRLRAYPHELSGGMRQRIMIALALATQPRLLLADEPTTALDLTTQEQILALLKQLQAETGMAMIFVTHDLAVARDVSDEVIVLYAGYVVERGPAAVITSSPRHPYTRGLVAAIPNLYANAASVAIPGQPPNLTSLPAGCPFAERCPEVRPECARVDMEAEAETSCACPFAPGSGVSGGSVARSPEAATT
jgi:oligopeptide/dipeptide ABC transporter ATP-binding protein